MRKISQNSQASNDKIVQLQNQVHWFAHFHVPQCRQQYTSNPDYFFLPVLHASSKRPTTSCEQSRTRQQDWGRATPRWPSRWASWRAWTESCRREAAQQTERRLSWRRSFFIFRAPWTQKGGTTARAQRKSESCKVTHDTKKKLPRGKVVNDLKMLCLR